MKSYGILTLFNNGPVFFSHTQGIPEFLCQMMPRLELPVAISSWVSPTVQQLDDAALGRLGSSSEKIVDII